MSSSAFSSQPAYIQNAPLYFHRVGEDESLAKIAAFYNVALPSDPGLVKPKAGDLVVIDLKAGKISLQ
jgi:hypothetical protein